MDVATTPIMMSNTLAKMVRNTSPALLASISAFPAFGIFCVIAASAQSGTQGPDFDVASIRNSKPGAVGSSFIIEQGGNLNLKNVTLRQLIVMAYSVLDGQVSGGPAWLNADRFDIRAKSEPIAEALGLDSSRDGRAQQKELLKRRVQSLLAERFRLVVRQKTEEVAIYRLVLAKGASKLQRTVNETGDKRGLRMQPGTFEGSGVTMDLLAKGLVNFVGRPVVDDTGLKDEYDLKLQWDPDPFTLKFDVSGSNDAQNASSNDGFSIFVALQKQLGLKLDPARGKSLFLIIESVQKPTAN